MSAHVHGIPPGAEAAPWMPLLYRWKVSHGKIGCGGIGRPNCTFDGARYQWERGKAMAAGEARERRFPIPLPPYAAVGLLARDADDYDGTFTAVATPTPGWARPWFSNTRHGHRPEPHGPSRPCGTPMP
ncbi:hypothetical protein [Streptomyces pinistramenti]|uniref:hypothetical protein n=1 Tax=Streptomyces pinistramenti TaxID=2884812 RepID=UPI001D06AB2E|nr:hypothetical protein [Streptomyces pinistramenti]MCB5910020.1 hypothetical protein [Streptomyces pinistramenti]